VPGSRAAGSEQHRHDQRSEHPPAHAPTPRGVLANWGRVDLAGLAALEPIDLRIGRQVPVGAGDGEHGGDGQPSSHATGGPDGSTLARSRLSSRLTKRDLYQHVNGGLRRTGPAVNVGAPAARERPGAGTRGVISVQQHPAPTTVSPGLHRPGLDRGPAPEPNLHLLGAVWVASCPTCGYQLATTCTQQRCERRAAGRVCPVCHDLDAA
jgi:hypothetical protein